MKKRVLSIFLTVVFLFSMFMFCATAFAEAQTAADGLSATLGTDKQVYGYGEQVNITLLVKNTSANVSKTWAKLNLPSGLILSSGEADSGLFELELDKDMSFGYVADTPALVKDGLVEENGKLYYYQEGVLQKDAGLVKVNGNYYYINANGNIEATQYKYSRCDT